MAEEIVKKIRIEVDANGAKKELTDVKDSLGETNKAVKDLEKTNLSNFSQKFSGLKDAFLAGEIGLRSLAKGALAAGKALFLAFVSNPVGAVIAAIVVPLVILYNLFKSFKPVTDVIERSFAAISAVFSVLKNGLTGLISGNVSLKNTFSGLGAEMSKTAKAAYDLAAAQQDLDDANQDLELSNAKVQTQIEQLTIQAKNRTITEKERLALFAQIEKVEKDQFEKRKKIADETERIAFEKMIQGKRLTSDEIKNIKELGLAEARRVLESNNLTDEQIGLWQKALIAQEQIAQQHNAIIDKGIIKQDQAIQTQKDDEQKAKDEKIAAAEKAAAKEKAINDKLFAEAVYYYDQYMLIVKAKEAADKGIYSRSQIIAKFNSERSQAEINKINEEILLEGEKYRLKLKNADSGLKLLDIELEHKDFLVKKEEELGKIPLKYAEMQLELSTKFYNDDRARLITQLSLWKDGTAEKIALTEELKTLDLNYFLNKVTQEENIVKISIENKNKILDKHKETLLAQFDADIELSNKRKNSYTFQLSDFMFFLKTGDAQYKSSFDYKKTLIEEEQKLVGEARAKDLISEEEARKRFTELGEERRQLIRDEKQARIDTTVETIDKLSQLNQTLADNEINKEKKKLQASAVNGVISLANQKAYDKKVSEIQSKAAKREKGLAIASAVISTAQAVAKSLTAAPFPFNVILAVSTAALGLAQILKIKNTPTTTDTGTVETPSSSGGSSGNGGGTAPNTSFSFAPTTATPLQTAPIKTYVLNKDVTTSAQLERSTRANATM